jgi:hypothetical protein
MGAAALTQWPEAQTQRRGITAGRRGAGIDGGCWYGGTDVGYRDVNGGAWDVNAEHMAQGHRRSEEGRGADSVRRQRGCRHRDGGIGVGVRRRRMGRRCRRGTESEVRGGKQTVTKKNT